MARVARPYGLTRGDERAIRSYFELRYRQEFHDEPEPYNSASARLLWRLADGSLRRVRSLIDDCVREAHASGFGANLGSVCARALSRSAA